MPVPQRLVGACDQFAPELLQNPVHPGRFDGREGDPVDARGSVVLLGHVVGGAQGLRLADVDVQAPELPGRVSLRLDVDPPPQVLQTAGRFSPAPLPPVWVGDVPGRRAPSLPRRYPPSSLLRAHPPPSRRRPISRGTPGYPTYPASGPRGPGRGGFRQGLDPSWAPCRRSHPAGAACRVSQPTATRAAFALRRRARPPGRYFSGPPLRSLALRPGDSLTIPRMAWSMGLRAPVSLLPAIPATGLLAATPAGLAPAERISLASGHTDAEYLLIAGRVAEAKGRPAPEIPPPPLPDS